MVKSYFKLLIRSLLWISAIIGGVTFTLKWNDTSSKIRTNSSDHLTHVKSGNEPHITILVNGNE